MLSRRPGKEGALLNCRILYMLNCYTTYYKNAIIQPLIIVYIKKIETYSFAWKKKAKVW
jgi:hypothetical protein